MTITRILLVASSMFSVGCTPHIALRTPLTVTPASCALQVIDARPDPEAIYLRMTEGTRRAILEPSLSEAIRRNVCEALQPQQLALPAKFTVTDFECTVTGFFEIRYVVDLRGHLELSNRTSEELRSGNVQVSSNGYAPSGCETAAAITLPSLSEQIAKVIQERATQK